MRSEKEMLDLILNTASEDERIRAVHLNGSRANPDAPRDIFQDYDIIYFVTEIGPFKENLDWISRFGERIILQMPDAMDDPPPMGGNQFTYLMQFTDGNRIDLKLFPVSLLDQFSGESLTIVLLDKDGLFGWLPASNDRDNLPVPPTAKTYADCCNEFWWVSPYVAKGLWRKELPYARYMLDEVVRTQLMKMLTWYIGMQTGFSRNPGKYGKYFQQFLEPELWDLLLETYAEASYEHTWAALFAMGKLFRRVAMPVAAYFGFDYRRDDDERVSTHLEHVKGLPKDAKQMY